MRRRRTDLLVFLVAFLLCKGSCFAQENFLARFLPRKEAETQLPNLNLPALQAFSPAAVDSDRHNHGVSLNNEGLEYLKEGNFKKAIPLFSKACDEDPSEPAFLFNLALALKNSGHNSHEAIEAFKKLMVMSPKDYQPSYGIGEILFEQMKKTKESLPFFSHANKLKPEDPKVATTLALAYFRAGYDEQSLALLKQNAHLLQNDPYPFYLMGIIFLKQENYIPAVRALKSALDKDKEGFVHDAYIRARFFAGQLEGLAEECAGVLKRFPAIINKSILERIHFSLIPLDVSLTETITISIKDPTFISRMDVLVSLPPEMPSHQHVLLENSEWISGEKLLAVNPSSPEKDGKIRFSAPPQLFSPLIQLRLKYSIRTFPWLGSKGPFSPPPYPKIEEMKSDETFCLSNAKLHSLSLALDKLPGNALQNSFLAVGRGLVYKENYKDYTVE
ncbi:tetratricopeptide repeat protein, partial [bacterium]|nr:tetratricopeptide repeat protein [bacterium]